MRYQTRSVFQCSRYTGTLEHAEGNSWNTPGTRWNAPRNCWGLDWNTLEHAPAEALERVRESTWRVASKTYPSDAWNHELCNHEWRPSLALTLPVATMRAARRTP